MTDVIVHRCTLRMVRGEGWSWGRSPDELVEAALEALPELIEATCSGLEEDEDDVVTVPAVVSATVSLSELERRGPDAVRAAFADGLRAARPPSPSEADRPDADADDARPPAPPRPSVRELLLRWLAEGVLDELLELLAPEAVEAWHCAVLDSAARSGAPAPRVDAATREMVEGVLDTLPVPATRPELLRARLALATAAAAPRSDWAAAAAVADAARPAGPRPEAGREHRPDVPAGGLAAAPKPDARGPTRHAWPRSGAAARGTRRTGADPPIRPPAPATVHALPFLVAVALGRIGYFDTLGASLDAAGLAGREPAFATALAYKVLEPPERGWRRAPEAERAATAFAGAPVPATELTELARQAPAFASALDATVAVAVMSGSGRDALLLHRAPSGELVLVDPNGSFPIALATDPDAIARVLRSGGRPPVHVSVEARSREMLAALRSARVPVDARRRTRRGRIDFERLDAALAATAARRASPVADDQTLERSLSLAAGLGLAMLAWTLWSAAGRTDSLLALERLGDLEARICIDSELVRLTLPMGRRQQDLRRAGMLDGAPRLPWLDGRRLELGT